MGEAARAAVFPARAGSNAQCGAGTTLAGLKPCATYYVRWRIGTSTAAQYTGALVGFFQACIVLR